jgi:hypothetical protein
MIYNEDNGKLTCGKKGQTELLSMGEETTQNDSNNIMKQLP